MTTNPDSQIAPATAERDLKKNPPSAKQQAIIQNVEKKLGPIGPGKHEQVRTDALLRWLRKQNGGK